MNIQKEKHPLRYHAAIRNYIQWPLRLILFCMQNVLCNNSTNDHYYLNYCSTRAFKNWFWHWDRVTSGVWVWAGILVWLIFQEENQHNFFKAQEHLLIFVCLFACLFSYMFGWLWISLGYFCEFFFVDFFWGWWLFIFCLLCLLVFFLGFSSCSIVLDGFWLVGSGLFFFLGFGLY